MALFSEYPYLCSSLALLFIFAVGLMVYQKPPCPMPFSPWISALLSVPYAFLSVFFVPFYWDPVRIWEFWGAGIEDVIFSFANGGTAWVLATGITRHRLILNIQAKRLLWRYLICSVSGVSFGVTVILLGLDDPMHGTLVGIAVVAVVLLRLRSELWPLLVAGAFSFGGLYTVIAGTAFALNPDFLKQWNLEALSGYGLFGVPMEEIVWSLSYGGVWPLVIAYACDARLPARQKTTWGRASTQN